MQEQATPMQRRETAGLVWHSSPDNRRDWMASSTDLCHAIVVLADNSAVLTTVHAVPGPHQYPVLHFGTFTLAARCAADRTAEREATVQPVLAERGPARYLAACNTDPAGQHWYLSTACLHSHDDDGNDLHQHCQGTVNHAGNAKTPGTCKWCAAKCVCTCHARSTDTKEETR